MGSCEKSNAIDSTEDDIFFEGVTTIVQAKIIPTRTLKRQVIVPR